MTDHLFQCEGAPILTGWASVGDRVALGTPGDTIPEVDFSLAIPLVDFRLELPQPILSALHGRSLDLVRIAAYCYLADQSISRGGQADVYGRKWRRRMLMAIEVEDQGFWSDSVTIGALRAALGFLTEDDWQFDFSPRGTDAISQLQLIGTDAYLHGNPGCVVLFSGGADSLAAATAAHREGARPLLVSHRPSPLAAGHQRRLLDELRSRLAPQGFRHVGAVINRRGSDAVDASQRSRALLFASLGTAVANALGINDIRLADNGVVSLNLPITDQAIGAMASRSTHPKFLRLFSRLAQLVTEKPLKVWNPFSNLTRPEVLAILREAGQADLLSETHSCAHPRGRTTMAPHCGACSQCVDRRFGAIAAGLQEHDPVERYETDIFRDELKEGEARTIATSYVRFALQVDRMAEHNFFSEFGQLYECIDETSPFIEAEAGTLVQMLKRHARSVLSVMAEQMANGANDLLHGRLPATCLIQLAPPRPPTGPATPPNGTADLVHTPDYSSVVFEGKTYPLRPNERAAVRLLHQAWLQGTPDLSAEYVLEEIESKARSMSELFKRSGLWKKLVVPGATRGVFRLKLGDK